MQEQRSMVALAAGITLAGTTAAVATELDSREYKLMLDATRFAGAAPEEIVQDFGRDVLKAHIDAALGTKKNGKSRAEGTFELARQRTVRFLDSADCLLNAQGYVLRARIDAPDGVQDDDVELTLKYRGPDRFLSAAAAIKGVDGKFEEDIAPVIVRVTDDDGERHSFVNRSAVFRSLYSLSAKQSVGGDDVPATFDDVYELFGGLDDALVGIDDDMAVTTVGDLLVFERVFKGMEVDLGDSDAKFDLTLWYDHAATAYATPLVAELSFDYKVKDDDDLAEMAERAMVLFASLQGMDDWFDPVSDTKTASVYATPGACG